MNLTEYQNESKKTAIYPREFSTFYPALGLAGEAGEIANKVKKIMRDGTKSDAMRDGLLAEIGDCLWYLSALATDLNADLGEIASDNIKKLNDRQNRGVIAGSGDNR